MFFKDYQLFIIRPNIRYNITIRQVKPTTYVSRLQESPSKNTHGPYRKKTTYNLPIGSSRINILVLSTIEYR